MSKEKIRKVDLSGLPRKEGVGANKGKVLIYTRPHTRVFRHELGRV